LKPETDEEEKKRLEDLGKTKIVAIDELDFVNSKDQSVLYNIFDWPHFKKVNYSQAQEVDFSRANL